MTLPHIIMWSIVACVGLPAAFRNPTALALVIAWLAGEAFYLFTGDNLPVSYYPFLDIFVLAVICAKQEACNLRPYRSVWHQLKCVLLERSPADRVVMLIFPLMWLLYVAPIHPFYAWYALWGLSIIQFLAAGWEAFCKFRHAAEAVSETPNFSGDDFNRFALGRGYG